MQVNFLAFDRASVRTTDVNGRMHVELTNISVATDAAETMIVLHYLFLKAIEMFYRNFLKRDPEPGVDGGGAAPVVPDVQAAIDAATAGLKAKNSELLGKLKDASANLQRFDGIDPDAVKKILSKFASDEEAGLIAKGEIDAVLTNRTKQMQADFGKQLQARDAALEQERAKSAKWRGQQLALSLSQAATKAGVLPEAIDDIVYRAQAHGWGVNDDGDLVATRGGAVVLGKDGVTPLTPVEWAEGLRDTAPHLWPKAQGSGAQGSGGGRAAGAKSITRAQYMAMQPKDQRAAVLGGIKVTD